MFQRKGCRMGARPALVVSVVRDAKLRSPRAKCFAMHGVALPTAGKWARRLFDSPMIRPQSFLVIDAAAGRHAAAIERQRIEGRWQRVVTLPADATDGTPSEG